MDLLDILLEMGKIDYVTLIIAVIVAVVVEVVKKIIKTGTLRLYAPFILGVAINAVYRCFFTADVTLGDVISGGTVCGSVSLTVTALFESLIKGNSAKISSPVEAAVFAVLSSYGEGAEQAAIEIAVVTASESDNNADNVYSVLSEYLPEITENDKKALASLIIKITSSFKND